MSDEITLEYLLTEIAGLKNELSIIPSLQRTCVDIEERLLKIERSDSDLLQQCAQSLVNIQKRLTRLEPPPVTVPKVAPFGSVEALVKQVEQMFDCKDGDHRAWHTEYDHTKPDECSHYTYTVLGLTAPASLRHAQENLRQALYNSFFMLKQTCKSERPKLYWRHSAPEHIQEEFEVGIDRYKIRARIAIPEADFSAVSGLTQLEGMPIPGL